MLVYMCLDKLIYCFVIYFRSNYINVSKCISSVILNISNIRYRIGYIQYYIIFGISNIIYIMFNMTNSTSNIRYIE